MADPKNTKEDDAPEAPKAEPKEAPRPMSDRTKAEQDAGKKAIGRKR